MLLFPAALAKEKLTATQQVGLKYYKEFSKRIPRTEMDRLREQAMTCAHAVCPTARAEVCGSYRRGAESSGDIDILLTIPGTTAAEGFVGEHKVGGVPKRGEVTGFDAIASPPLLNIISANIQKSAYPIQGILARVVEKMKSAGFVTDVLSCGESKVRQTLISACTSKAT